MSCLVTSLKAISGFLTPLIALIATYIAYQQYRNNKKTLELNERKLKLDLFEKRFRVFTETKNLLLELVEKGKKEPYDIKVFKLSILEREFIFDPEMNNYIKEIIDKAYDLSFSRKNIDENILDGEAKINNIKENSDLHKWIVSEYQNIESQFLKYLDFRNL